jgi:hypothetical protein
VVGSRCAISEASRMGLPSWCAPRSLVCADDLLSATLATYEFRLLELLQK